MQETNSIIEILIKWFVYGMLIIIILTVSIAFFDFDNDWEANIGSFDCQSFNDNWTLSLNDSVQTISLPYVTDAKDGDTVIISNTLPQNLTDGSSLMIETSFEDAYIYVNDRLREQYAMENDSSLSYYMPSSYIVTELDRQDAGAKVTIKLLMKDSNLIHGIRLGLGNNAWFDIIGSNITVSMVSFVVLILGLILVFASEIMRRYIKNFNASFFLGLLMTDVAIWILSESKLRQIILAKPSLTGLFSYIAFELFGVLTCLFFDEVQHHKYHKCYVIMEVVFCLQLSANILLHVFHIKEFHDTLVLSHILLIAELFCVIATIILDIRAKRLKSYKATAIGMAFFIIFSMSEMAFYYLSNVHVFGNYVCIGLVILTVATVIQVLIDQAHFSRERENKQKDMIVSIVETIAGAIDAKDEYTGGHSERVGHYATILAREMACDYDFSEEDILRIHYIGNMHDIGKIGVTDTILNKVGRLTEDEFTLIKRHVNIGADLMATIGDNIEGLIDGVLYHHERFDGKGYPEGLSETDIPLVARIICIVDCYDAMTSNRVYRKRLTNKEVREEFVRCSGTQFDPALTEIFIRLIDSGRIVPYTIDGMAASESGALPKSSILEGYLHISSDTDENKADNPNHIRMLCYIMKFKEKCGKSADVFLIGLDDDSEENWQTANSIIKSFMDPDDIYIQYNSCKRIVTLFDKSHEQIDKLLNTLNSSSAGIQVDTI